MPIEDIPTVLGLSKSSESTLRNYVWSLKNKTGKYLKLAELMHIDGDNLCLNTTVGYENGHNPEEATGLVRVVIDMGDQVVSEPEEEGVTL